MVLAEKRSDLVRQQSVINVLYGTIDYPSNKGSLVYLSSLSYRKKYNDMLPFGWNEYTSKETSIIYPSIDTNI